MLKGIIFNINFKLSTLKLDTNEKYYTVHTEFSKALKIFKSINHPYSDLIIFFLNKYRFLIPKITDKSKIHEIVTFITQSFENSNKDFPYSILICLSQIYFDYGIQQLTNKNYGEAIIFLNRNLSIQYKLNKIQTEKYYFNISQTLHNLIKLYLLIGNIAKAKSLKKHLDKI